jgi:hypothetical protein
MSEKPRSRGSGARRGVPREETHMKSIAVGISIALLTMAASSAQNPTTTAAAVENGAKWLASVQGADGGWGQDGGNTFVHPNQ